MDIYSELLFALFCFLFPQKTVDCMTTMSVPSTLVKCLYLFFDLPHVPEVVGGAQNELPLAERRALLQKVFVQVRKVKQVMIFARRMEVLHVRRVQKLFTSINFCFYLILDKLMVQSKMGFLANTVEFQFPLPLWFLALANTSSTKMHATLSHCCLKGATC